MKILRKFLFGLFFCLFLAVPTAHALDPVVTVGYIHKKILAEKQIDIPVDATTARGMPTLKYLYAQIDLANEMLNGFATTDYEHSADATSGLIAQSRTDNDIINLIKRMGSSFYVTVTNVSSFDFQMAASGEFSIDWGDGTIDEVFRTPSDIGLTTYSHSYSTTGNYTIKLSGLASGYNPTSSVPAIAFNNSTNKTKITAIAGDLGGIFPIISSTKTPRFYGTFNGCTGLTSIPADLFTGLSGAPSSAMFAYTFNGCTGLTSIPAGLFANISGAPTNSLFVNTFNGCTGITAVPADLFAGISGAPQNYSFTSTFSGCTGLTSIPAGLFAGIHGTPAISMFAGTFMNCTGLTSVPSGLFGEFTGTPANSMFYNTFFGCNKLTTVADDIWDLSGLANTSATDMFWQTFQGCTSLASSAPKIAAGSDVELWEHFSNYTGQNAFRNNTKMVDYAYIPIEWGGLGQTRNFFDVTVANVSSFDFQMSASGGFRIYWGDGTVEDITRTNTTLTTYSHSYASSGNYTVRITGLATGYSTTSSVPAITFSNSANKTKMTAISGDLGKIFPVISSTQTPRFYATFSGCSGLTSIPVNLFASVTGAPVGAMFAYTFHACTGLTGAIPSGLFAGISGAPIWNMFTSTFNGCTGLTSIPKNLFAGISGAPGSNIFDYTFANTGITSIPGDLFSGIIGAPMPNIFAHTFQGCTGLTSIPADLFANISGAPAANMFAETFRGCTGITSVPAELFGNISGAPASYMFNYTFGECTGLTSIPTNLFVPIHGVPAKGMFSGTFSGCSSLASVPSGVFGTFTGAPAEAMFADTFWGCSALADISDGIWDLSGVTNASATSMFYRTFQGCTNLMVSSPKIAAGSTVELWQHFSNYTGQNAFGGNTKMDNYECIPTAWGGGGQQCIPESSFDVTVTGVSAFSFEISASGNFTVNWGDGTIDTITRTNTTGTTYSHTYSTTGNYVVKISGLATGYSSSTTVAAISFNSSTSKTKITAIAGDLGERFPILNTSATGSPRFNSMFNGCTGLTSIPANLFASVTGAPVSNMFNSTFANTGSLTSIPAGLFAGISGAPAEEMFSSTFRNSAITSVPAGLFDGISGAPAFSMFAATFSGCTGLTSVPAGLFDGISGAPAEGMFASTFSGCTGLTSVPSGLFGSFYGSPAAQMFNGTFNGCSGLTTIANGIWDLSGVTNASATNMFNGTFAACTNLRSAAPTLDAGSATNLWEHFTIYAGQNAFSGNTKMEDYACVPTAWGGMGQSCESSFKVTLTGITVPDPFDVYISASGNFIIDWGDGTVDTINKTDTILTEYSHIYFSAGDHVVKIYGRATDYSYYGDAAISFNNATNKEKITTIAGDLGEIFPILNTGGTGTPRFTSTFQGCTGLTGSIPGNLFAGIVGAPVSNMFSSTFNGCSGLTGSIPAGLFAGISGAPALSMFNSTFYKCSGLTGPIPGNLFSGIVGAPAQGMFAYTFSYDTGLTSIPANLFAGISGEPEQDMFRQTFGRCPGLKSVPSGLFAGISGAPASNMFNSTFWECTGLTSIPSGLFAGISGAPAAYMFRNTFNGCTNLTSVPSNLFGVFSNQIDLGIFEGTFKDCANLVTIANGIWDLSGIPNSYSASDMFKQTFAGCTALTGQSPSIKAGSSTKLWQHFTTYTGQNAFSGATGLSDYSSIPAAWK